MMRKNPSDNQHSFQYRKTGDKQRLIEILSRYNPHSYESQQTRIKQRLDELDAGDNSYCYRSPEKSQISESNMYKFSLFDQPSKDHAYSFDQTRKRVQSGSSF